MTQQFVGVVRWSVDGWATRRGCTDGSSSGDQCLEGSALPFDENLRGCRVYHHTVFLVGCDTSTPYDTSSIYCLQDTGPCTYKQQGGLPCRLLESAETNLQVSSPHLGGASIERFATGLSPVNVEHTYITLCLENLSEYAFALSPLLGRAPLRPFGWVCPRIYI